MKRALTVILLLTGAVSATAAEVLFTDGPQEYEHTRYYWLAEWKVDITLPPDASPDDRLEVLFGSKGSEKRTLLYEYDGKTASLTEQRTVPYEWLQLPICALVPGKHVVIFGEGSSPVAFIAGVRVSGKSAIPPAVKTVRTVPAAQGEDTRPVWSDIPGFEMTEETRLLWQADPDAPDWNRAARSSEFAGIALDKVQRWLHECCLPIRDGRSGLFRPTGAEWNYRDTAADCYPFYVWASYFTDLDILNTVMLPTLEEEQRLCNHLDRLPVSYDMDKGEKVVIGFDDIIFGSSEYAKDGLVPIVELTGRNLPWLQRMRDIVDDVFKHAPYETPYGLIPSTNVEVNGDLLQILPRLYSITREQKYLDWAFRLADYYLLPGGFVPDRLSDHGCEIIGGLGLLFAVARPPAREKCEMYRPHLEYLFDEVLRRGTNSDGLIVAELQDTPGPHDTVILRDGWGYDFVGFLDVDFALNRCRYGAAVQKALSNLLKPRYLKFNWDHNSRDNVADSVEGGLYLLYRFPVPEAFLWADREIATLLVDHANPDRLWGVHKLEANTVRTVLIHTMLHTRNTLARPWQQGLRLGAAPCGKGICLYLRSEQPYEGHIQFDVPRHRIIMGFEQDWPRMNAVPEWFTVEPDETHPYQAVNADTGDTQVVSGLLLSHGFPVSLDAGKPLRLIVTPYESGSTK